MIPETLIKLISKLSFTLQALTHVVFILSNNSHYYAQHIYSINTRAKQQLKKHNYRLIKLGMQYCPPPNYYSIHVV